jgi:hypothetical protein
MPSEDEPYGLKHVKAVKLSTSYMLHWMMLLKDRYTLVTFQHSIITSS